MIDKLTPEQIEKMTVYRDIGIQVGLATGATNREAVIPAFQDLFKHILNLPMPPRIIFCRSPMEAQKLILELDDKHDKGHKKLNSWTMENNDEWVKEITKNTPDVKVFESTHNYGYGSAETYWIQYSKFFRDEVGVKLDDVASKGVDIFEILAKNSGFHYLFEEAIIVCDRALSISIENGQLHNDEGPATEFGDGYKLWYINGHEVTERIVMEPKSFTARELSKIENAETKRIAIERFGASEYMFELGGKVIDYDCLNLEGSSPRSLMEDSDGNRWLIGTDGSTGRVYHMPVLATVNTCREAHESICGIPESMIIGEC